MTAIRTALLILAGAAAVGGLAGCPGADDGALTVATAWPARERSWFEDRARAASTAGLRIRWTVLAPGDDLRRVVLRRVPPDLILGGPATVYQALAARGRFATDAGGGPVWSPVPAVKGLAVEGPGPRSEDPRRDSLSLDRAALVLKSGPWAEGYAQLVRDAGDTSLKTGSGTVELKVPDPVSGPEGAAVVRGARHARQAIAVLERVFGRAPQAPAAATESGALLADLLGATLVDARDELIAARAALDAAGRPERPSASMSLSPPWPPASVARLLGQDQSGMPMLETLAAQIAPDADVRAALVRSWLAPARPIDGALLDELAGAVDGRLAREPRFRSWLRGEWTAWARQRYRRVERQVVAGKFEGAPV